MGFNVRLRTAAPKGAPWADPEAPLPPREASRSLGKAGPHQTPSSFRVTATTILSSPRRRLLRPLPFFPSGGGGGGGAQPPPPSLPPPSPRKTTRRRRLSPPAQRTPGVVVSIARPCALLRGPPAPRTPIPISPPSPDAFCGACARGKPHVRGSGRSWTGRRERRVYWSLFLRSPLWIGGAGTVGSTPPSRVVEFAQARAGDLQSPGMEGQGGGGSVSNVELCNLAYAGQLEEVKERLVANRSLATRADQVGPASGRERGWSWWP